jgi:short-subunit dehydrogenase
MSYAIITGASKGIGREIAFELAKRQYNLILVARSENLILGLAQEIESRYNVSVEHLALDLSIENAAEILADYVRAREFPISVLVNNAGYGLWGSFEKLSLEGQLNMLRLNNDSLISITYKLLPLLRKAGKAYILNIASTTAYQAIPYMSVYAASKAFVVSFSRGLAVELSGTNVSVTCVSPGATDTNFIERAGIDKPDILKTANKVSMTAEAVAKLAVEVLFEKKAEFIPGFINKFQAGANNFLPKRLIENIAANIYKPS